MKQLYLCLLIFVCSISLRSNAQTNFEKHISKFDYGHAVINTSDGGKLLCGSTFDRGAANMTLVKLDPNHEHQWSTSLGNGEFDQYGIRAVETPDGGYVMCGHADIGTGPAQTSILFSKFNNQGELLWREYHRISNQDNVTDLILTSDSGFVFTGYEYSSDRGILMKLDKNGQKVWAANHKYSSDTQTHGVVELPGGDLVVSGFYGGGAFISRYSSSGTHQWTKTYSSFWEAFDITLAKDGNLFVVGRHFNGSSEMYIMKVDLSGNILWANSYGASGSDQANIVVEDDKRNIYIGGSLSNGTSMLIKTDSSGNYLGALGFGSTTYPYIKGLLGLTYDASDSSIVVLTDNKLIKVDSAFTTCAGSSYSLNSAVASTGVSTDNPTIYTNSSTIIIPNIVVPIPTVVTTVCGGSYCNSSGLKAKYDVSRAITCLSDEVYFFNESSGGGSYQWKIDGQIVSTGTDLTTTFNNGTHTVELIADNGSCTNVAKTEITAEYCASSTPDHLFDQSFPITQDAADVSIDNDNGFLIASIYDPGSDRAILTKTDSLGNYQWSTQVETATGSTHVGEVVRATPEGGYLYSTIGPYATLTKLDQSTNEVWTRDYTNTWIKDIIILPDSNYIITGEGPCFIAKINKTDGSIIWQNTVTQGSPGYYIHDVFHTTDDHYFVTGYRTGGGAGGIILKFDGSGTFQWYKQYQELGEIKEITMTSDSNYVCVGHVLDYIGAAITKIDSDGKVLWMKSLTIDFSNYMNEVRETPDKGLLIVGAYKGSGSVSTNGWGIKTDQYGNLVKSVRFYTKGWYGKNNYGGFGLVKTSDDGYVFTGDDRLIKTDMFLNGCNTFDVTTQIADSSILIVPQIESASTNSTNVDTVWNVLDTSAFANTNTLICSDCNAHASFSSSTGSTCDGDTIYLTNDSSGPTATYQWYLNGSPFATGSNPMYVSSGGGTDTVLLEVSTSTCTDSAMMYITVNSLPTVVLNAFSPDTICSNSSPVTLPNATPLGGTYMGAGVNGGNWNPVQSGTGTFDLIYSYFNGTCEASDTTQITIEICTDANLISDTHQLQIFPNPSNGLLTVLLKEDQEAMVQVYTTTGKVIYQKHVLSRGQIDLSEQPAGIYFVKVVGTNYNSIKKIMLNH